MVLRYVGIKASTFYHLKAQAGKTKGKSPGRPPSRHACREGGELIDDLQLRELICRQIEGAGYAYGYRKLAKALRRDHQIIVNHKKIYRLCQEMDILRPKRRKKARTKRRISINRTVTKPDQLYEADIKYGYINGENRFFFVMPIIDVYDREIVGFHIGRTCEGKHIATTLQSALLKRQLYEAKKKPVLRTDNGPQFTGSVLALCCEQLGIEHELIPCRTPNKNAHIEAFNAILQEECLGMNEFETFAEAYECVCKFIEHYNKHRIHGSLKYHTPEEAHRLLCQGSLAIKEVRL